PANGHLLVLRLGFGLAFAFSGLGRRCERRFVDPARLDPGLHYDRLRLVALHAEPVENAGLALGLAVLALDPAGQVVGRAAGEILDRLDAVFAEGNEHT